MITTLDDMPEENRDAELEALFGLNDGVGRTALTDTAQLDALKYELLEKGTIQEALDDSLKRAGRIALGMRGFFHSKHEADLRAAADQNPEELGRLIEHDNALERARQIAGVIMCELLYTARSLTAQQLLREMDNEGAREVAEWLDVLVPEDYFDSCPDEL